MLRLAIACLLCVATSAAAQVTAPDDSMVTIGTRHVLHSTILGQERPYLVYAPPVTGRARWPVIVVLDGDGHFHHVTGVVSFLAANGRMPRAFVVAVPNTDDRTRDLTPATRDTTLPTAGGADRMLTFLVDELLPEIDRRYPTTPYRVLVGHSFGGLFATHAWLTRPGAFQAYVAVSPSLWWDDERLTDTLRARLTAGTPPEAWFYATMGGLEDDGMLAAFRDAEQVLRDGAPSTLDWRFVELPDEDHGTTPHRSTYAGLEAIFRRWWMPRDSMIVLGVAGIDRHYRDVVAYYRFPDTGTPEAALNRLGYQLFADTLSTLRAQGLEVFRTNARRFPRSANVYDSLGDAYRLLGQTATALACYGATVRTARSYPDEGSVVASAAVATASYGKLVALARELGRTPWEKSAIPERVVGDCVEGEVP